MKTRRITRRGETTYFELLLHVDIIKRRHDKAIRRGQQIIKTQDWYIVAEYFPILSKKIYVISHFGSRDQSVSQFFWKINNNTSNKLSAKFHGQWTNLSFKQKYAE